MEYSKLKKNNNKLKIFKTDIHVGLNRAVGLVLGILNLDSVFFVYKFKRDKTTTAFVSPLTSSFKT